MHYAVLNGIINVEINLNSNYDHKGTYIRSYHGHCIATGLPKYEKCYGQA